MMLYSLTLQQATGIVCAAAGNFTGEATCSQEVVVARAKALALLRPDDAGTLQTLLEVEVFGAIRSLERFRLPGSRKDYLVVGSDSGRIVILEYNQEKNLLETVHLETFGKSGCRRVVPGQYLAVDPTGRALMIAACQNQKLVYVLNRDNAARLTISSPLEAHQSHTLLFCITALDCGFDNPTFAAIELDYDEDDATKRLTLYEVDLGLNHVVRKWTEPIDSGANLLVAVPGGGGGVLVCAENFVIYKNQNQADHDVRALIPRRHDLPLSRGTLIVSAATHKAQTGALFLLLQTEYGDVFRVTLDYGADNHVTELTVQYFDTIPVTTAMCILRPGFLFAASEFGNHSLYQLLESVGEEIEVGSSERYQSVLFKPRQLRNLVQTDDVASLMPIIGMRVENLLGEEAPQMLCLCGRGPRSSLRILRRGVAVTEVTAVSPMELHGAPTAVWTVKKRARDEFDAYMVLSFQNATVVLSIGEAVVEEISDSGVFASAPSLAVGLLGDDSLMQVHPSGVRLIRAADGRVKEWRTSKIITAVGFNSMQVVVALHGGELVYFQMDMVSGQVMETAKREMASEVACLAIVTRQHSRLVAVGSHDSTIRLLSLNPDDCMEVLSVLAVSSPPASLLLEDHGHGVLNLNAGLQNGVLLRSEVDKVTGKVYSETQTTRFLGLRAPKLFSVRISGGRTQALLCLSSRPWLGYTHQGRFVLTPLLYEALEYAAALASSQCAEGVVALAPGGALRVFTIDRLGETFNQTIVPLRYTPRKFILHPTQRKGLIILESDQGAFTTEERDRNKKEAVETLAGEDEENCTDSLPDEQYGYPKANKWVSCVRVLDAKTGTTTCLLELEENEAALSLCSVTFRDNRGFATQLLAVGTAKALQFMPKRDASGGFIHIYRFAEEGKQLELVHKTAVDGVPTALCEFQGRLLVGVGQVLRIYDLGKRKLLRKCENRNFPNTIISIHTCGDRVYVGDIQESFHYVKYQRDENQLYIFADDSCPRWLTASLHIDFDTMAGADKFGNLYLIRLPQEVSEEIEDDPTGGKATWEQGGLLKGAPNKAEEIVQFHVGEVVTSLQKASLIPGGRECVIYSTVMGSVGALLPFSSREDVDFFSHLEMHLRQEHPPLCGRDHMAFRSAYFPVKGVIDGDLCEQYPTLTSELQRKIADALDRTPREILKKLEDIRSWMI